MQEEDMINDEWLAEMIAEHEAKEREEDPFGAWLADEGFGLTKDGLFYEIERW